MKKFLVRTNHLPAERFVVSGSNYAEAEAKVLLQIGGVIEVSSHVRILSIKELSQNKGDGYVE